MTQEILLNAYNANAKTVVVEDPSSSTKFWSDYFTKSYVDKKDHFIFKNSFDLMGRPLNAKSDNPISIRRVFARKQKRSKIS